MTAQSAAAWLGVLATTLQLVGGLMTLWSLLSALREKPQVIRILIGALWRSPRSEVAAELSQLNAAKPLHVLQGVAVFALGYLLAIVSQIWNIRITP